MNPMQQDGRAFEQVRRQQLLPHAFYADTVNYLRDGLSRFEARMESPSLDDEDRALLSASQADFHYQTLSLLYTAGSEIEPLRRELERTVVAYEQHAQHSRKFEGDAHYPVFGFQDIDDFERLMQLVGLCYLLHRRDLIPRLHALIADSAYDGEDAAYEELVGHVLQGRPYLENWYHHQPYLHLLNATDKAEPADKTSEIVAYCLAWYPAMTDAPWHGSHTRINGTEGDYFGYWAFEAGAIALLYDIDDSSITHMVYPKDLVAWARANKHLSESAQPTRLRCEAGQPCPREGFWFTPAQVGSRRLFKTGELMHSVGGDYGMTIWQWDQNQTPPKP